MVSVSGKENLQITVFKLTSQRNIQNESNACVVSNSGLVQIMEFKAFQGFSRLSKAFQGFSKAFPRLFQGFSKAFQGVSRLFKAFQGFLMLFHAVVQGYF